MTRLWIAAAVTMALTGAAYLWGRHDGTALCEGAHAVALAQAQKATIRAAEQASRTEAARLALKAERDDLARELEDAAHADDDATGGLPRSRVDRLRQR